MSKKKNKKPPNSKKRIVKSVKPNTQPPFSKNYALFLQNLNNKSYQTAISYAEKIIILLPKIKDKRRSAIYASNIGLCYFRLKQYKNAIKMAEQGIQYNPDFVTNYDLLSQTYGELEQKDQVKHYGNLAISIKDKKYRKSVNVDFLDMPEPPSVDNKLRNIISFSLYGDLPRYCETAFLNIDAAEKFYPHWTCRIYVDDSVPENVISRLQATSSQIVFVTESQKNMMGTCWRFLALDDDIDRVIFRDIDSILCSAEAMAVDEWVQSGQYFHTMRDGATHTALLLAGMWGAVVGILGKDNHIEEQILEYIKSYKGISYFTDQAFLREEVWSTICQSLCQHDSQFGFNGASDFPIKERGEISHIGCDVGTSMFVANIKNVKDGNKVTWRLVDTANQSNIFCEYQAIVNQGRITVNIARQITQRIENKSLSIRVL